MTATRALPTLVTNPSGVAESTYVAAVAEAVAAILRWTPERLTTIGGTANDVVASIDTSVIAAPTTVHDGKPFSFVATSTNTGAMTININATGALGLKRRDGSNLVAGDVVAGEAYLFIRVGSVCLLISPLGTEQDELAALSHALLGGL